MSALKTGVALAQTVLRFAGGAKIAVDGSVGDQTQRALASASPDIREQAKIAVKAVTGLNIDDLIPAVVEKLNDFGREVVPALITAAKSAGLIPEAVVAQVVLESGWGQSQLARQYHNYGGLKYNSVSSFPGKKPGSTQMRTTEFIAGNNVSVSAGFATFDSPRHFAEVYVWYLLSGGSSYRYRGIQRAATTKEYFEILKKGGYATDPEYVSKSEALVASVKMWYRDMLA